MKEMDLTKLTIISGRIKKCVQKSVNDILKPYDISSVHAPYLVLLLAHKKLIRKDFNEILNVDKAHTTRVIQDLERKQFIISEQNARNGCVVLTDKGIEVAQLITKWLEDKKTMFLKNVKDKDLKIFIGVLQDITNALEGE